MAAERSKRPEKVNGRWTLWGQFAQQRRDARKRGIRFTLSFEQWVQVWFDSGQFYNRGRLVGQYVMARFGDRGPYSVDNVEIILCEKNHVDGNIATDDVRSLARRAAQRDRTIIRWKTKGKESFGHG